jgi:hypothetical protein
VVEYECFRGPYCLYLQGEDGDSMDLWNVSIQPQHYTVSQPTRPRLEPSSKFKNSMYRLCTTILTTVLCSQLKITWVASRWAEKRQSLNISKPLSTFWDTHYRLFSGPLENLFNKSVFNFLHGSHKWYRNIE